MSIVFYTLLIPKQSTFVERSLAVGRTYYQRTKGVRNHGLGAPHLHIWDAWMCVLLARPDLEKDEKKEMNDFQKKHCRTMEMTQVFVKLARSSKTFDDEMYRIQMNAFPASQNAVDCLIKYMQKDGAELKMNAAPKGPRERRLEQFLRGQMKKNGEEDEDGEDE